MCALINSTRIRQGIAVWLSAMLVLLSFAVSAHDSSHHDEGASTHCTLCFHQHQLNKTLPSTEFKLAVAKQTFESEVEFIVVSYSVHQVVYHSRAPPVFS
ncbi:zinc ABC transporter [Shewanella sp. KT0246]|nr:zinc ABC transporter [Shewanella sp. KT0246]